jgi:hypothetical protein
MYKKRVRMILRGVCILAGCILTLNAMAGTMGPLQPKPVAPIQAGPFLPWIVIGSLGYTHYQNVNECDDSTAFGRFAISKDLISSRFSNFGLEVGLQSGNSMRLSVSEVTLDELGGLPIQSVMKPMLDVLVTARSVPLGSTPFFAQFKGGITYREWQFQGRDSVPNKSEFAGEVQAGFGYSITQVASVSLLYQRVYGGNPNFNVSDVCPSGFIETLPTQQGIMLSFSLHTF